MVGLVGDLAEGGDAGCAGVPEGNAIGEAVFDVELGGGDGGSLHHFNERALIAEGF